MADESEIPPTLYQSLRVATAMKHGLSRDAFYSTGDQGWFKTLCSMGSFMITPLKYNPILTLLQ